MSGPDPTGPLARYVEELFTDEGAVLEELRAAITDQGLPEIYISAEVGKLLQLLLSIIGARRVLEIGTLGGYSALWMARALPADGRLVTLEVDPDRAAFARRFVAKAGMADVVEVREGDAREILAAMVAERAAGATGPGANASAGASADAAGRPGPFDAVFIDADKESYVEYLERSLELVRPGGLILADNAFRDGRILDDDPDEATRGVLDYNERAASDPRLDSTIIPVRDGVVVSVVRG
ncbi:MAG: O-methyltransferase [Candidatus Longimicrobiales bacterium M2_2A_002]